MADGQDSTVEVLTLNLDRREVLREHLGLGAGERRKLGEVDRNRIDGGSTGAAVKTGRTLIARVRPEARTRIGREQLIGGHIVEAAQPLQTRSLPALQARAGKMAIDNECYRQRIEKERFVASLPLDANDPDGETIRQPLTISEEASDDGSFPSGGLIAALVGGAVAAGLALTTAGRALWGRITQFFAGSILGALILGRKRDRCRHCNKPLTDKEGILVDEDDSYECADNTDDDHHELKRRRES